MLSLGVQDNQLTIFSNSLDRMGELKCLYARLLNWESRDVQWGLLWSVRTYNLPGCFSRSLCSSIPSGIVETINLHSSSASLTWSQCGSHIHSIYQQTHWFWPQVFHFQDGVLHTCTGTYLFMYLAQCASLWDISGFGHVKQGSGKSDKASPVKFFSPACVNALHVLRTYLKTQKSLEVITVCRQQPPPEISAKALSKF